VPDHGKLTPWRFIVFEGDARARAGDVIAGVFAKKNPAAPTADIEAEKLRLMDAPLVIAVVSFTKPHPKVPAWDRVSPAPAREHRHRRHRVNYGAAGSPAGSPSTATCSTDWGWRTLAGFIHIGTPQSLPRTARAQRCPTS
jgi:hypothetical protein